MCTELPDDHVERKSVIEALEAMEAEVISNPNIVNGIIYTHWAILDEHRNEKVMYIGIGNYSDTYLIEEVTDHLLLIDSFMKEKIGLA